MGLLIFCCGQCTNKRHSDQISLLLTSHDKQWGVSSGKQSTIVPDFKI